MEKLLESLAKKYELPVHIIEYIGKYQFKYVADHIKANDTTPIRLMYFGAFMVPPKKKEFIELKKRSKDARRERLRRLEELDMERRTNGEVSQSESSDMSNLP